MCYSQFLLHTCRTTGTAKMVDSMSTTRTVRILVAEHVGTLSAQVLEPRTEKILLPLLLYKPMRADGSAGLPAHQVGDAFHPHPPRGPYLSTFNRIRDLHSHTGLQSSGTEPTNRVQPKASKRLNLLTPKLRVSGPHLLRNGETSASLLNVLRGGCDGVRDVENLLHY